MPKEKSLQQLIAEHKDHLNDLYVLERKQQEEVKSRLYKEAREIINNPLNWEFRVKPDTTFGSCPIPIPGRVRVHRQLKPEVAKRCRHVLDFTLRLPIDPRYTWWVGGTYYRTEEDILTSADAVLPVLREPMLCNGVEWARILRNDIPEKFLLYPTMK